MSAPQSLLDFQKIVAQGVLERIAHVRGQLDALADDRNNTLRASVARNAGAIVLYAPTGAGKTLLAADVVSRVDREPPTLWFWFAPFGGLVDQARATLRAQAPAVRLLDLETDRKLDAISGGGIFVTTWQSVAAANQNARRARTRGDAGAALDDLLALAREQRLRIGCVVDEAHHGFQRAKEARNFFTEVLRPDYALMMTATPRDADVARFEKDTGYRLGASDEWMTVSRQDGVDAGLLKRGVKVVRFIAPDNQLQALIDFERTALEQCTRMHRHLSATLKDRGISMVPLMLVQVPDGGAAMHDTKRILTADFGFADAAVRIHTANEPDPDFLSLAWDPSVEVLIFKMAVAMGFDAPRAFTLAALRGARDKDFGIQVIGRLMRVHPLLRRQPELPPELSYGYVFLANAQAQEGLLAAGAEIERLSTQAPALGSQTFITVVGDTRTIQVLRSGETASLLIDSGAAPSPGDSTIQASATLVELASDWASVPLFSGAANAGTGDGRSMVGALTRDAAREITYRRADFVPARVVSEYLPPASDALEVRVADFVDFSPSVLGAMHQTLAHLMRIEGDVFRGVNEDRSDYVATQLGPERVAARVRHQMELFDVDVGALFSALTRKFIEKAPQAGFQLPADDELLDQALDLVLLHHPELLRNAFRLARMQQVSEREVELPALMGHPDVLPASRKNIYRVFPPNFDSEDERDFARWLDRNDEVLWWHRNPVRRPDSLVLYRWDDGAGFFPDFLVAYRGRETPHHLALVEVKGPRSWPDPTEVRKAGGPAHALYGRCVFVGRERGGSFKVLRPQNDRLAPFAEFELSQLRWVDR